MKVNFFWSGDNFTYLHKLTILSHIKVGHEVIIWLHGDIPKSKYWITENVEIKNADEIIDITHFMKNGGNFKTASSLWRFSFLHRYGGWYSDTDAIATCTWPNDKWVICSANGELLSTGILKVPSNENMFLDMINNLKYEWGNVKIFNDSYQKYKGNIKPTHNSKDFFPFKWNEWKYLLNEKNYIEMPKYSIHLYHTMFERANMIDNIELWCDNNPETILGSLKKWIYEDE